MSSFHVGCQAEVELAFQHYFSHCLNLANSHSCQIAGIKNMIETFHNSPKRQSFFQRVLAINKKAKV